MATELARINACPQRSARVGVSTFPGLDERSGEARRPGVDGAEPTALRSRPPVSIAGGEVVGSGPVRPALAPRVNTRYLLAMRDSRGSVRAVHRSNLPSSSRRAAARARTLPSSGSREKRTGAFPLGCSHFAGRCSAKAGSTRATCAPIIRASWPRTPRCLCAPRRAAARACGSDPRFLGPPRRLP